MPRHGISRVSRPEQTYGTEERDVIVYSGGEPVRGAILDRGDDVYVHRSDSDSAIHGGPGHDRLIGGSGNDYISGWDAGREAGDRVNDILRGGEGDDHLTTGSGRDILFGGQGSDIFGITFLDNINEQPVSAIIRDFEPENDTIEINTGYSEKQYTQDDFVVFERNGNTFIVHDNDELILLKGFTGDFDVNFGGI